MMLVPPVLGRPHHTAYVVDQIEVTVNHLAARLGAGPFFLIEDMPLEDVTSRGEPARFEHDSAFGSLGGYPIELIQVRHAAPQRVEAGLSGPLPRVQHVGYALAPDVVDRARAHLDERGATTYLSSRLNDAYTTLHDTSAVFGHDIEILVAAPALEEFFGMVLGAADGWDGTEPLRRLEL